MFQLLGSAIQAGTSVKAQKLANDANLELADKTAEFNKEAAELEYQRNVEMWNMENAYNTPAQQMARMIEAGLNPNLVYGSGNVVGNTSSGAPSYNAPMKPTPKVSPVVMQLQNLGGISDVMRDILGIRGAIEDLKQKKIDTTMKNVLLNNVQIDNDLKGINQNSFKNHVYKVAQKMGVPTHEKDASTGSMKTPARRKIEDVLADVKANTSYAEYQKLVNSMESVGYQRDIYKHQVGIQDNFKTGNPAIDSFINTVTKFLGGPISDLPGVKSFLEDKPLLQGLIKAFGI